MTEPDGDGSRRVSGRAVWLLPVLVPLALIRRKRAWVRPKNVIRQLKPGETPPEGEPRRYNDSRGYVRLRWKVGRYEYVETYEHRLVCGVPDAEVHHRDEDKGNNDVTNLVQLTKREHAIEHSEHRRANSKRENEWGGLRSQRAFDRRQRALARQEERRRVLLSMADMYRDGMSTNEIAAVFGKSATNISRGLRSIGVLLDAPLRRKGGDVDPRTRQIVQARAHMRCERCGRNLTWIRGHVHHRKPRGMGGSRVPERHQPQNLLYLCTGCHEHVEAYRADAYTAGWLVAQSGDSCQIPALVENGSRWVYLTADGAYSTEPPESRVCNG